MRHVNCPICGSHCTKYTEKYKGHRSDKRANTQQDLIRKVSNAKKKIDEGYIAESDMTLRQWATRLSR